MPIVKGKVNGYNDCVLGSRRNESLSVSMQYIYILIELVLHETNETGQITPGALRTCHAVSLVTAYTMT